MLFSTLQFMIAMLVVVVCAQVGGMASAELSWLALALPLLWLWPVKQYKALVFGLAMLVYGWTLPYQPFALSVALWTLFPLWSVSCSKSSHWGVLLTTSLITVTLLVGLFVTQEAGKLAGQPWLTVLQAGVISIAWWTLRGWQAHGRRQWSLLLLAIPLWVTGQYVTVLVALCLVAMIATVCYLHQQKDFAWANLLCWTLPTVAFAALILAPSIEVPKPIFVIWMCLLGTAWMTDYVLRTTQECEEEER